MARWVHTSARWRVLVRSLVDPLYLWADHPQTWESLAMMVLWADMGVMLTHGPTLDKPTTRQRWQARQVVKAASAAWERQTAGWTLYRQR